jgi:glycosyltransferase involved in cell wall biosynthesis
MRIAQVAPLAEAVPPGLYGGTERVVSWLTEELVRQGHQVTLFASGDSETSANLVPSVARGLRLAGIRDYFRREPDWLAVSGLKGSRIFYRKAVIACGGKIWHHIAFEYPAVRKRQMDPFVIRASRSIDHAEYDSCGEPRSSAGRPQ